MRTRFKNGRLPITDVEQTVLRFVWLNPGKSRAEIAEKLNLSKSMLSKAVQTFEQMQLVIEERSTPSEGGRGQPPIRLFLNKNAFYSIGLYLTPQDGIAILADLSGAVQETRIINPKGNAHSILEAIRDAVGDLIENAPAPVIGIGQAVPAIVRENGTLFEISPRQFSIPFQDIAALLRETFELPVYWENAAYCIAGFEAHKPESGRRCVFHLTLDSGIGGGLVIDGKIFRGAYNQAANFGALIPETGPRPNLPDLAQHLGCPIERLTMDYLIKLFKGQDAVLVDWIKDRGNRLSQPLSAVVQLYNPDTIVLGGSLPFEILSALCAQINLGFYDLPTRRSLIKPSLTATELLGPSGLANAAAILPVGAELMGLSAVVPKLD